MLKSKPCTVEGCDNPRWSGGYCQRHQNRRTDGKKPKGLSQTGKPKDLPSYVPFYVDAMSRVTGRCQECGTPIGIEWRQASIAHILPKSKFPSVAFNQDNWIELGVECGCHGHFDTGFKTASTMEVWPLAREKFRKFKHLILSDDEKRRIPPEIE